MLDRSLERRRQLYFALGPLLVQLDNSQLSALLSENGVNGSWGKVGTIKLGQAKVFVKRIPITDVEYAHMFSTKNVYGLPAYYNYGFESAGLGVFRELAMQVRTTHWVLQGAIATFPLMYHYRIVPFAGPRQPINPGRHAEYVAYWGGDANISRYLMDRARAGHELVLFLEHFPYTAATYLLDYPEKLPMVLADMRATIKFLRAHGVIHLDADFFNVLTDGRRAYLTDFGLALDRHFELTLEERSFYKRNINYDYGNLLLALGFQLYLTYRKLPDSNKRLVENQLKITGAVEYEELMARLLEQVHELDASGALALDKRNLFLLERHRGVIEFMHKFYTDMRRNNRKDTPFRGARLRQLLQESGFLR